MSERKSFTNQWLEAERTPRRKTNLRGIGIGFEWEGTVAGADKMRQAFTHAAAKARYIYLTQKHRQGQATQLALSADFQKDYALRPGKLVV